MASVFKRKGEKRWTIAYFDHEGRRREKASGTTDKRLAERIASDLSDRVLERTRGLVDPVAERLAAERTRPLSQHFDDYERHLDHLQRNPRHVEGTLAYLTKAAEALDWRTLGNIDAGKLAGYLSEQAEKRGTSARTYNANVVAWRAFGRWCVRTNRLASDPLATLSRRNTDSDRRRVRRDVLPEELARIIAEGERSPTVTVAKSVKGKPVQTRMTCPERAWAYRIAAGTGFRAAEVASLTPEAFDLDDDGPTVTVEAGYSKRRRRDTQPIRPDLAAMLGPWLASKPEGEPVCPLPTGKAGALLRADVEAARARWIDEAPTAGERAKREASDFLRATDSRGRVIDFHALRVHFISRVVEAGANVKEAMELARHSDPKLTLKTYAKVGLHSLAGVLDRMDSPDPAPEQGAGVLLATGTDNHAPAGPDNTPQNPPQSERGKATGKLRPGAAGRDEGRSGWVGDDAPKPLRYTDLRETARANAGQSESTPHRTRTCNPLIKSQLLYRLS